MEFNVFNTGLRPISPALKIKLNKVYDGKTNFGQNPIKDSFQNNSVAKFCDETKIKTMISANPELQQILSKNNIPIRLNMKELQELIDGHCKDTQKIAMDIFKNLPIALQQKVNIKDLKDGALLHDFGKVLIPDNILNKNGSLTSSEHKIMDLHPELGYQLLKNSGMNDNVLNIIRYHHNNSDKINKNFIPDMNVQIVNLADKYSALTEKRVYKEEFSPQKALTIIYSDVKKGEIHPFLFNALVKSVQNNELKPSVNKC